MFISGKETKNFLLPVSLRKLPTCSFIHSTFFTEHLLYIRPWEESGQSGKLSVVERENSNWRLELNVMGNDGARGEHLCLICMGREGSSKEVRFELRETPMPRLSHEKTWRLNIWYRTVASTTPRDEMRFPTAWRGGQHGWDSANKGKGVDEVRKGARARQQQPCMSRKDVWIISYKQ